MIKEGDLLWTPDPQRVATSNLTKFTAWLARERGLQFADYHQLWRWSVEDIDGFWHAIWDYFGVQSSTPWQRVLGDRTMPGTDWFPEARLNYAQHVLRNERAGKEAIIHLSENAPLASVTWDAVGSTVRVLATQLRRLGVQPGGSRRCVHAEYSADDHGDAGDHQHRRGLGQCFAGFRYARRARPIVAA